MIKRWWWLIILLAVGWLRPQPVQAATTKVLLTYDSQNGRMTEITALQQLLTASGVAVHTQPLATYQAGQLADYAGVVTMVNWDDVDQPHAAFTNDRAAFSGITLHVGGKLEAAELQALGATATPLYRRQLEAQWPDTAGTHLMPYQTPTWVLTKTAKSAVNLGSLTIQGTTQRYPYATINGRHGFIPYFDGRGLSELAAATVVARLFGKLTPQAPLFLVTGVTPYTNLTRLRQVGADLQRLGIPFAISATSVAKNTELKAFKRYTAALRSIQAAGGVVFLETPIIGNGLVGSQTLATNMTSTWSALAQQHVFPIGASAPTYWQNDRLYRQQALRFADTQILLPDPVTNRQFAQEDDQAPAYRLAFATTDAAALASQRYGARLSAGKLDVGLPLAITFAMPDSQHDLTDFKRLVGHFECQWRDPATLQTEVAIGVMTLAYQKGQYLVNGRPATGNYQTPSRLKLEQTPQTWINKFFARQSRLMWVFFAVAFTIMIVLLIIGRRIYLRMYQKK